jgi:hypothetical protein
MSGQDLMNELAAKVSMLDVALKALGDRGRAFAQSEMDYRIALAEKILVERDKNTPVTIIGDIGRGDRKIAKLRFDRTCAEIVYKAALEAINVYKLQAKILENQIDREWNRS